MAETQRTKDELLSRLANNGSGEISAQDMREVVESLAPSFGGYYVSSPATTSGLQIGVFKFAEGTTLATGANRFTHANNRLTYTGTAQVHAHVSGAMSFQTSGVDDLVGLGVAKNGVLLPGHIKRLANAAGDLGATGISADTTLIPDDYLEIWVATFATGSPTITLETGHVFATGIPI